ncbi:hypothetical protein BV898_13350 [Hypsibius exemplaris]|uniref:Uncharacterized protein n=1 Tax=Hypsibius exemplaris TaxID=2072580 RepID=A0A1W0WB47_HYPEX|nr:hypothetical protein BV898_13350 [Hypsibius exemplaris]
MQRLQRNLCGVFLRDVRVPFRPLSSGSTSGDSALGPQGRHLQSEISSGKASQSRSGRGEWFSRLQGKAKTLISGSASNSQTNGENRPAPSRAAAVSAPPEELLPTVKPRDIIPADHYSRPVIFPRQFIRDKKKSKHLSALQFVMRDIPGYQQGGGAPTPENRINYKKDMLARRRTGELLKYPKG